MTTITHVAGNTISKALQFIKVNVATNLVTTSAACDMIMTVISQKSQPLIVGNAYADTAGYSLRVAEVAGSWTASALQAALVAAGATTYSWATGNVTVTITSTMDA